MIRAHLTASLVRASREGGWDLPEEWSSGCPEGDGWVCMRRHVALVDWLHARGGHEVLRTASHASGLAQEPDGLSPRLTHLEKAFVKEPEHWIDVLPWVWRGITRDCGRMHRTSVADGVASYSFVGLPEFCVASEGLRARIAAGVEAGLARAGFRGRGQLWPSGDPGVLRVEVRYALATS